MANFRQVHCPIWKDEWVLELEPEKKLLFIYLFTNESSSLAGIYKLPMRVICFETGLDQEFVTAALGDFERDGKVYYQDGIVWVVNMRKFHETKSVKVQIRIKEDIASIPHCDLKIAYFERNIGYGYGIDTDPLKEEEEKEDKKEDKKRGRSKEDPEQINYSATSSDFFNPVKILADSSGLSDFPADQREWIEVIHSLVDDHGIEETTKAMKQACQAWRKTKSQNGHSYRVTNLSWINWAQNLLLGGDLPSQGKQKLTAAEKRDLERQAHLEKTQDA